MMISGVVPETGGRRKDKLLPKFMSVGIVVDHVTNTTLNWKMRRRRIKSKFLHFFGVRFHVSGRQSIKRVHCHTGCRLVFYTDIRFVKKFTRPDFQAENFTH